MARPTLFTHRKFRALSVALKSQAMALGSLELLWHSAYESGDPLLGGPEEVEAAADWRGKKGRLSELLVTTGFLDQTEAGLEVHDLFDHAPDYVVKRAAREEARASAGTSISDLRRAAVNVRWAKRRKTAENAAQAIQTDTSEKHLNTFVIQTDTNGFPPTPTPTPVSISKRKSKGTYVSAEPLPRSTPEPLSEFVFPTTGNPKEWTAPASLVAELSEAYDTLNVPSQMAAAVMWAKTNPGKRKTARGMPAFLNRWMSNHVNGWRNGNESNGNGHKKPPLPIVGSGAVEPVRHYWDLDAPERARRIGTLMSDPARPPIPQEDCDWFGRWQEGKDD